MAPVENDARNACIGLVEGFLAANPGVGTLVVLACGPEARHIAACLSTTDHADALVFEDNTCPRGGAEVMRLWDYQGSARINGAPNARPNG